MILAKESDFEVLFDVNVFGVFRVTKAFAPMIFESNGRIVNISFISGVLNGGGYGMYAASKHALAIEETLGLDIGHEHSYTGDELIQLIDAMWPYFTDDKPWDDLEDEAEMRTFMQS